MESRSRRTPPDQQPQRGAMPRRRTRWGAAVAVVALLAVAGCGISGNNDDAGDSAAPGGAASFRDELGSQAQDPALVPSGSAGRGLPAGPRGSGNGLDVDVASLERAQIKKAALALRSDKVGAVVTSIETIATAQGGFIDSENTATDAHGVAQSSSITMRVPVDAFATTLDQVARLGRLETKKTTTEDVTGEVADVASRVSSAKESIAQLRVLFSHATKLGDIITLESELSARESDLEALEAQQRVLAAQTSLSTITVSVARETTATTTSAKTDDDTSGFLGGLRQGWDALVTAFEGTAHALGAVLPIGLTLTALGLLVWAAIRRLPSRRASTSGSPRPAE